jgi:hypothetical protein
MSRTTLAVLVILTVALAAWAGDTGLGTDPYSSGDELPASTINTFNNQINDNAADILVLEGYFSGGLGDFFSQYSGADTAADFRTAVGLTIITNGGASIERLWQVHQSSTPTITDFDDGDDHSEFSDGDYFVLIVNYGARIDFSNNSNIEGNANTDFTGSASQIVVLKFHV